MYVTSILSLQLEAEYIYQCCSQGPNVRDQDQDQGLHVRDQDQDQGLHVQDQDQPVRDQELQHPRPRPRTKDFRAFALVSRIPIISDTFCQYGIG